MGLIALQHEESFWTRDENPCSLHWQVRFLTIEPPGKSLVACYEGWSNAGLALRLCGSVLGIPSV